MSVDANKALYHRYLTTLFGRNLDALDMVLSPDFVGHDLPKNLPGGSESLKQFRRMVDAAFPDQEYSLADLIAEDDRVVGRLVLTGTHRGAFMGVAPTGKRVTTHLIEIVRIEAGKIVERWVQRDRLGELQQLGLVPPAR